LEFENWIEKQASNVRKSFALSSFDDYGSPMVLILSPSLPSMYVF